MMGDWDTTLQISIKKARVVYKIMIVLTDRRLHGSPLNANYNLSQEAVLVKWITEIPR